MTHNKPIKIINKSEMKNYLILTNSIQTYIEIATIGFDTINDLVILLSRMEIFKKPRPKRARIFLTENRDVKKCLHLRS